MMCLQVTVSFEQSAYTVAEGSSETIKVVLSADPERTVEVPITSTDMDGASSSDYSLVPQTVVFNSGDTEKTFSFSATDDTEDDDGERVRLNFGTLPPRVSSTSPSQAVVSITDDDVPSVTVSFEESSYTVAEGEDVTVKVKLSADPERTVTIPLTKSNQGGASNSDYSNVPGNVVFNSGDTEKTFSFSATQDTENDDGESVKLGFGNLPTGVSAGSTNESTVSITDDDVPSVTVSFEESSYTVGEGNSITVKVKLDVDPERTVTIPVTSTGQGGASSSDYSVPNSVVFNSGDTEKEITFSATADDVDDDGESVKLSFQNLPTGVSAGSPNESTVSITDDDTAGVTVSDTSLDIDEGDSDTYTVVLDSQPTHNVTITVNDPSNTDVTADPADLTFTPTNWDTARTVTVTVSQDSGHEDEDGTVTHTAASTDTEYAGISIGSVLVNVTDDDDVPVTVSFGSASYSVIEGNTVAVKVKLSADPERTVTIPLTKSNQGGASNSDYSNVPANVVFNSGDTEKEFTFSAMDDTDNDDGESVKLGFGNLPTGVSAGSTDESTVSITDDDVPSVTVSFEQASYTVAEGDSVTVKVILSAQPERSVDVPVSATYLHGVGSTDFLGAPTTLNFGANDTEKTINFSATDDSLDDDGEKVRLSFGNLPAQVTPGSISQATVSINDNDHPQVTVSFGSASYTVAESDDSSTTNVVENEVSVTIELSADPERTVTIPITATGQGGATASDYSVPNSVVFNAGDTEKEITFQATPDDVDDDGESVKLGFGSSLPARITTGSPAETTVSITDDDVPSVTASFEQSSYAVAEGSSEAIKVVLSADPERTVTIPLLRVNQGGADSSDYSGVPQSVVFNSGDTEKTFEFEAIDDAANDDGESVKVSFGTLPDQVSAGSNSETTVSITDDDVPSVTVSFEETSYTVGEGNTIVVKVVLSADPERTVTIPLTKTNQGGATASDYSVPSSVVFNDGNTEKELTFSATEDTDNDDGESVKLGFGSSLPIGVTAGSPAETTVSITDDDVPQVTVSFEQSSYTVAEGNSVTVKVKLDVDPERAVTIPLTKTNQGGASNSDYSNVPGNVVFNSGETEKTFSFSATQDTADDDGESVKLGFGNSLPAGVTVGSTDETTVSITDDDVPSVTVSFEQSAYTVAEGSSETIKLVLSADPERTVEVPITSTDMDGASSSDYSIVPQTVVFNSGDTEKEFTFSATQDTVDDDGERVRLNFGTLPPRVSSASPSQAVVSITDDDVTSVTVSFEQSSYAVAEGNSVTVKVKLSADPKRTVTVPITKTNQGGASSSDYSVPSSVVFNSGDTEKTVSFSATQDTVDDDGESVKLGFGNSLPTGVTVGSTDETTVSITDDDVPSVTVSFEQSAYTVAEGSSEAIKVVLSADPERTVEVPISATDMDGASSSDYSFVPQTVVFNSGDTEKTLSFSATDDSEDDDGERVRLNFGTLPPRVSSASPSQAVVSITDDDVPSVTVSFEESSYTVSEGNSVTVKVKLDVDPERTVTIPLTKSNQGGASNSDYSVPSSVVFNSGDTEKTFNFSATADDVDDDGESVKLGFQNLPTGVSAGSTNESTVSITDDDTAGVTVSETSLDIDEGDSDTYTVVLDSQPTHNVTITVNDPSNTDVTADPADLTFTPTNWDTAQTVTVTASQDSGHDDEDGTVTHTAASTDTKYDGISVGNVLVNVTDDDDVPVTVSFEQDTYSVIEGENVTVTVTLSADPERTVTIPITATNQDDASSEDYSVPSSVVFSSGDTEKTFDFEATDDEEDDNDETVKLTFGGLPTAVSEGTTNQTVVSIVDNDGGGGGGNKGVPEGDVTPVTVNFEQASYTVAEGNSITVKVTLDQDPERTVTIPLTTTNQGGVSSADHSPVPASVEFASGDTEKTFSFSATQDTTDDDGESVKVGFGDLPDGVTEGTTNETTISITDDDVPSVTVNFQAAAYSLTEGWTTDITITLSADPERNVSVPLTTTNGTGATSGDYSGVPATVDFASGDTEKSFTFTAEQDDIDEDAEELTLGFDTLPDGVSAGTTAQTVVTIADSIHVSFDASYYEAYEGGSGAVITVQLDNAPALETVIPITATGMDGATSADWTGVPPNVTFASGDTQKTFTVMAYDDQIEDDGESVELGFGNLPAGIAREPHPPPR